MKRLCFYMLIILLSGSIYAQNIQGKVIYTSRFIPDRYEKTIKDPSMEASKKKVAQSFIEYGKRIHNIEYELKFNCNESLYKKNADLSIYEDDFAMLEGTITYCNLKEKYMLSKVDSKYSIKDTLNVINWTLGDETKEISGYKCNRASYEIVRRDSLPKQQSNGQIVLVEDLIITKVVAWYAPEVPIYIGPGKFVGLPGLVLQLEYGDQYFPRVLTATEISINPQKEIKITKPKARILVEGQGEYDKLMRGIFEDNRK